MPVWLAPVPSVTSMEDRQFQATLLGHVIFQSQSLYTLNKKVDQLMTEANATQADIDALTGEVTADRAAIAGVVSALNALLAAATAAGASTVNVADLKAAVAGLTTDIAADAPPAPVVPPVIP